jgi:hypothetical protein
LKFVSEIYIILKSHLKHAAIDVTKDNEQVIIDKIIEELDRKREVAINKKQKSILKDEVSKYVEEEDTIDYILFIIHESTGKLY